MLSWVLVAWTPIAVEDAAPAPVVDDVDDPLGPLLDGVLPPVVERVMPFGIQLHGRQVRFDGARHTSRLQRGWATCPVSKTHGGASSTDL